MALSKLLSSKLFLLVLLIAVVFVGYFFSQELNRRYQVEKDIGDLKKQITGLEKGNQDLTMLVEYFQSASYKELEARQKLNLQKPGEHVVSLPNPAELESARSVGADGMADARPKWRKWWDYFFLDAIKL